MGATLNYFSLLGISEDASQDELEARYQALSEHLASTNVPPALREWAEKQAKLVDEAYAVLSDPEQRAAAKGAKAPPSAKPEPAPAETEPAAAAVAPGDRGRPGAAAPEASAPDQKAGASATFASSIQWRSLATGAIGGLIVLAVVLVARSGGGDGNDGAAATPDQNGFIPVDTARVAELMKSVQADPKNPETLFELGEIFFQAGEWQSSLDWFTKLVAVDPTNTHALTDIGTNQYNLAKVEEAKATWLKVLEITPDDPQIHYNLGFLYANSEPQDLDAAREEWTLVIQLAPESDLAQTVKLHLDGLAEATTTPQATPTPP